MASRNSCIPFCKHCDFLEGIACLRHGMTFFWCCCCFASTSFKCIPKLGPVGNQAVTKGLTYWIFVCEPVRPSWHWLPEHSLFIQHEIYSLWAWWSQVLSAGRAIISEDQCTVHPTKRSLITRSKGILRYNMHLAFTFWNLAAGNAQYTGVVQWFHNITNRSRLLQLWFLDTVFISATFYLTYNIWSCLWLHI